MNEHEHTDRVAVITGGGRGFGKAFGHALAGRGAHVVLADLDADAGGVAAAEIRDAGGSAEAFQCDVADEQRVAVMVEALVARHGGVDILINNAGLHSAEFNVPMATSGVDRLRRLFDVNVMGVIICTLAVGPTMAGRQGAAIVNISSSAAYGCPTAYGVSKLAVQGLTMTSARELGPLGVRVNAIAPGLIFTETIRAELPPEVVDHVKGQQIIDRDGAERDIVEAMLYLVSDRAAFVTGETLRVSGGFTLQI
jgi:NAD(P)-dependent dehydrogenase (short-subunit alcohol dehydrogenase family)